MTQYFQGEFNSGKSTVINALLGERYLKDGVVPTTNEITFLRYTDLDIEKQRCERFPDGQYICYLPAPILKEVSHWIWFSPFLLVLFLSSIYIRLFFLAKNFYLRLEIPSVVNFLFLKQMTIVDTPGTNVILQRQQRLTEEFVPRADLLLFVISADRPLTGSEV